MNSGEIVTMLVIVSSTSFLIGLIGGWLAGRGWR